MIELLRRMLPKRRPTAAEITQAWQDSRVRPPLRTTEDLDELIRADFGDPGEDRLGTNRWASPIDAYPWVKTDYDRWIHIGGWAVRSDRQVVGFQPGTERRGPTRRQG